MAKRILIVEDQSNQQEVLALVFKKWGFEVETAFDGADAIDLLHRVPLDGMTLGIRMPRMNGFEVLRHLRQTDQKMPVIIISGWLAFLKETDSDYEYLRDNAQGLLMKPVTTNELKPIVDRWFGKCF